MNARFRFIGFSSSAGTYLLEYTAGAYLDVLDYWILVRRHMIWAPVFQSDEIPFSGGLVSVSLGVMRQMTT